MTRFNSGLVGITALMSLMPAVLLAGPVHAPVVSSYSLEINPSSDWVSANPAVSFNGGIANFEGFGHADYMPGNPYGYPGTPSGQYSTQQETLSLTFTADPGQVFYGLDLGLDQWSYSWMQGSGVQVDFVWSVTGGNWAGTNSAGVQPSCANNGIGTWWMGSGSEGCFRLREGWSAQGGGGFSHMPLMGTGYGTPPVTLDDVTSFTLNVDAYISAGGGGYFGDGLKSGFGFSWLSIMPYFREGTPSVAEVPEPGSLPLLAMGLIVLGSLRLRRTS